jgi:uncharacterized Zn finger protein (UPF0148 family)
MNFCPNCGHANQGVTTVRSSPQRVVSVKPKVKRAPSAYNKRYAAHYKRLKKAHPRSSFAAIAKKAHKASKKGRKK